MKKGSLWSVKWINSALWWLGNVKKFDAFERSCCWDNFAKLRVSYYAKTKCNLVPGLLNYLEAFFCSHSQLNVGMSWAAIVSKWKYLNFMVSCNFRARADNASQKLLCNGSKCVKISIQCLNPSINVIGILCTNSHFREGTSTGHQ